MEIEVEFSELPIGTDLGFEFGLLNGEATISFHRDGEWVVKAISLDGHRKRSPEEMLALDCAALPRGKPLPERYEYRQVNIDWQASPWLYGAILDQLENNETFKDYITDRVVQELEQDGGYEGRSDYDEHSTLNAAQQGL